MKYFDLVVFFLVPKLDAVTSLGTCWHHAKIIWRHIFNSHLIVMKNELSLIDCTALQSGQIHLYLSMTLAGRQIKFRPLHSSCGQATNVRSKLISLNHPHNSPSWPCCNIGFTTTSKYPPWSPNRSILIQFLSWLKFYRNIIILHIIIKGLNKTKKISFFLTKRKQNIISLKSKL